MIRIDLLPKNTATSCGYIVKAKGYSGPIGKLCRQLIDAGYAAHDVAEIYNGKQLAFKYATLSHWAGLDVSEGESFSVRMVKHKPFAADVWG